MSDPTAHQWRRLAAAVLRRAVLDARSDNGTAAEARRWLPGDPFCLYLLDAVDLDRQTVAAWVSELPELAQPALPFIW